MKGVLNSQMSNRAEPCLGPYCPSGFLLCNLFVGKSKSNKVEPLLKVAPSTSSDLMLF